MGYGAFVQKLLDRFDGNDKEFAEAIGVHPTRVSLWKGNKSQPRLSNLEKMSEVVLKVPFDQCLRLPDESVLEAQAAAAFVMKRTAILLHERVAADYEADQKQRKARLRVVKPSSGKRPRGKAKKEKREPRGDHPHGRSE